MGKLPVSVMKQLKALSTASFDESLNYKALDVMQGMQINVINREKRISERM